jgi:hypothetical protein
MDLGDWLLVRWSPAPSAAPAPSEASAASLGPAWLPLSRADAPQDWHLLRVLLLSARHRSQSGTDGFA